MRCIKPSFWEDDKVAELSMQAKLVFIGLWNFADDLGTVSGNHTFLRNRMLPYADISAAEFSGWMAEIVTHGLAGVFCYKGVEYMYISGFAKHQTINTPNYTDLLVPPKASPLYAQWLAKGARARQGAAGKQSATGVFGAEPDVVEVRFEPQPNTPDAPVPPADGGVLPPPPVQRMGRPGPQPPTQEAPGRTTMAQSVPKQPAVLFRECRYADFAVFEAELAKDPGYAEFDMKFYYDRLLNWSDQGHARANWIALAKAFMAGDERDGNAAKKNKANDKRHGTINGKPHGKSQRPTHIASGDLLRPGADFWDN